MEKRICTEIDEVIKQFCFEGTLVQSILYGSGHINDTYLLQFQMADGTQKKLILQRINHDVFPKPAEVMENIQGVTAFLRKKIIDYHGNPDRETLNLHLTREGKPLYTDAEGNYWRVFDFIEGASCYDQVEKPEDFYQSAVAFGRFQCLLADYPAETLHETIVGFHDTAARLETFKRAVKADVRGRAQGVKKEIQFVLDRENVAHTFGDLQKEGQLPLRVTHNDTKLNNVMIDDETGRAICVIDLDTVMPGFAMNDFGDSIRFGASTAAEDEQDLSKVSCDLNLFELYTRGYLEGCGGKLTDLEVSLLPMGAKMMTYECGMRFLTDYLQGDIYFKTHRENQNLDRCRTQFKLVADMEQKWEQMEQIVQKYMKNIKTPEIQIRMATVEDAPALLDIYAPYVKNTAITFEYEVPSLEEFRERIRHTLEKYPYLVAVQENDAIVGYAYAGAFKGRAAYGWAIETSIYVKENEHGKGIGKKLYQALEELLKKQHILNLNACITYPNPDSISFHEKQGYRQVAHFTKCGYKLGKWHDMIWMEKMIGEHEEQPEPVLSITEIQAEL